MENNTRIFNLCRTIGQEEGSCSIINRICWLLICVNSLWLFRSGNNDSEIRYFPCCLFCERIGRRQPHQRPLTMGFAEVRVRRVQIHFFPFFMSDSFSENIRSNYVFFSNTLWKIPIKIKITERERERFFNVLQNVLHKKLIKQILHFEILCRSYSYIKKII